MTSTPVLTDPVSTASPIAVGGVGGSGTRVVAHLLQELGVHMGHDLNRSLDDLSFTALFKRRSLWPIEQSAAQLREALEIYLTSRGDLSWTDDSADTHRTRVAQLMSILVEEDAWQDGGVITDRLEPLSILDAGTDLWGWKEPNTHIVLPFLFQALPNMKYVHIVRNGLDMAFSTNQNQLDVWGDLLLGRPIDAHAPNDAFDYWCCVHERLLAFLPKAREQILIVRFESLLQQPDPILETLSDFIGIQVNDEALERWRAAISTPITLGRYAKAHHLPMDERQAALLEQFGYLV
jgi:hypothetical protein